MSRALVVLGLLLVAIPLSPALAADNTVAVDFSQPQPATRSSP